LQDGECAVKSGRLDYLNSDKVRKNFDLIVSSGHVGKLIEKHNNLMTERIFNLTGETASNLKSVQDEIGEFKNESQESNAKTLEAISKNSDEIKNVAKKFEETLKLEMAELRGKLERDIAEMKTKLEESLEKKFSEILQKKFDDFARKLVEVKRE
jgi:DNA anti-recombination protein RmuC